MLFFLFVCCLVYFECNQLLVFSWYGARQLNEKWIKSNVKLHLIWILYFFPLVSCLFPMFYSSCSGVPIRAKCWIIAITWQWTWILIDHNKDKAICRGITTILSRNSFGDETCILCCNRIKFDLSDHFWGWAYDNNIQYYPINWLFDFESDFRCNIYLFNVRSDSEFFVLK